MTNNDATSVLFNVEIERNVLSNILSYKDIFSSWHEYLTKELFYYPKHIILFNAAKAVYDSGKIPDALTVGTYLSENNEKGAPDTCEVLEIASSTPTSASFEQHLSILVNLAKRRRYWKLGCRLQAVGTDMSVNIEDIDKEIDAEREKNMRRSRSVYDMKAVNAAMTDRVKQNYNDIQTMLPTGFPYIDDKGGFQYGDLNLIGGATSMGKSTFATNIAVNVASCGIPSMVFTLEMTVEQMAARINAPYCLIPSYVILYKKLQSDQIRFLDAAKAETENLPLFIEDSLTAYEDIRESIRSNAIQLGVKLFIIDYLQTLNCLRDRSESEASFYERICRELKNLAKELKVCIILVVQFNRDAKGEDPRPRKEWIRGSGGIEQAADTILLLYRPEYYGKRHKYRPEIPGNITEVIVDKGRNIGGTGSFFADYKNERFFEYLGINIDQEKNAPVVREEPLPF